MALAALVLAVAAALLHVLIFAFESVLWTRPSVYRRFGLTSQADADTTRPMAYNQGFYNLFLAIGALTGVIMVIAGSSYGWPLIIFSCGCMFAASLVLVTTGKRYLRAAASQGTSPLLALLASPL